MGKRNIVIGGAWPYANSSLHLGHLAALIGGDVLARYFRLNGDNVVYVSVLIVMVPQLLKELEKKIKQQKK